MAEHPHIIASRHEELLPRIAAGDEDAFVALFRKHSGEVFRFALHMTGSRWLADDVTQEVFLAVIRSANRYVPGVSSEIAWLRGVARNHVRRRLDSERRTVALPSDGEDDCPAAREAPTLSDLMRVEQIEAVRTAVASLPARYREIVVLCDLQELSYADAAAVVGCAVGTVRSRLSRARALLASKLRMAEEPDGGPATVEKKVQARWAT